MRKHLLVVTLSLGISFLGCAPQDGPATTRPTAPLPDATRGAAASFTAVDRAAIATLQSVTRTPTSHRRAAELPRPTAVTRPQAPVRPVPPQVTPRPALPPASPGESGRGDSPVAVPRLLHPSRIPTPWPLLTARS